MMTDAHLRRAAVIRMAKNWPGPVGAAARPVERKPIGVEDFLAWAYRQELRKAPALDMPGGIASSMVAVYRHGDLLASIDFAVLNRYGLVVDLSDKSYPHEDAVIAADFIQRLARWPLVLPEGWNPLSDMSAAGLDVEMPVARAIEKLTFIDQGQERLRVTPEYLLVKHALVGGAPGWQSDMPQVKTVSANGKARWFVKRVVASEAVGDYEAEFDGYDRKAKRPIEGAYRKTYLDPDPMDVALSRSEYELWHSALGILVDDLTPLLSAHELCPTTRPARPWEQAI